ncbi:TetR/AcrR family transcriptional regulator [Lactobacillus sp. LC28-10]|uniref:TetR/AcrR family transcriptional regulator n=1 Tax=Secundilactobacillus angelensis TaxID=2722706 RepID=A0ABX1KZM3_9LACO|nr:TetR/AcrR family transcriptional regulator [Secundilactobacillus angelensis]MCH5461546.1 TetR/AcrR family transcriptional regulator [Secundilactobacillus angelensis]NLR19381.1 TetR/AcrR family transcriptional regulator [Secundilactobacillus angelensis]
MGKAQERTRRQILSAFLDLLGEKPYDMISVSEISVASFITRSTFYRYFPDKNSLLMAEIEDTVQRRTPDQPLLVQFVEYVEAYWPVLRNLMPTRQSRSDLHEILNQILWELIQRRVDDGPQDDPVITTIQRSPNKEIMISAIEGMLMGILERYVVKGSSEVDHKQLEAAVREINSLFQLQSQ